MPETNEISYHVPFISDSSLASGLRVSAALGGGPPHAFLRDTGSVGIRDHRRIFPKEHAKDLRMGQTPARA